MKLFIKTAAITAGLFLIFCSAYAISNEYIEAKVGTTNFNGSLSEFNLRKGRFSIGVPPSKSLLYGYPTGEWSSITTVKITGTNNITEIYGADSGTFLVNPFEIIDGTGSSINSSTWSRAGFEIKQELKIVDNQRTANRKDTIEIKYSVKNTNATTESAGLRVMLDTQLANKDNAPIEAAGIGVLNNEREWTGSAVPEAWQAFDDYINPTVRAEGLLKLGSATAPDKFFFADWEHMKEDANIWDGFINTGFTVVDTAVAVMWNVQSYTAGQERVFITYYGLPDVSGAELSITKTADVSIANYGDTISYNVVYSNTGGNGLSSLNIWDSLPWNTTFVDASPGGSVSGRVVRWALGSLSAASAEASVWFRASINALQGSFVTNTASSEYNDSYWLDRESRHSNKVQTDILTATVTETATVTATPSITPTHTITPTASPTPPALELKLKGNFPNPFPADTKIVFHITAEADITVKVFTVSGEIVVTMTKQCQRGSNNIIWDGRNTNRKKAASGVYIYKIEARTQRGEYAEEWSKMAVVR